MRSYFITFRSVTFAQRAERVLQNSGIGCSLQRTPRWMEEQGCGYCLRLRDVYRAVNVLRQKQITFRKAYLQLEDGNVEEVPV